MFHHLFYHLEGEHYITKTIVDIRDVHYYINFHDNFKDALTDGV